MAEVAQLPTNKPENAETNEDDGNYVQSHDSVIKPLFSIPLVNRCCIKKSFSFIIDLAELMDTITTLYDKNFVILATEQKIIIYLTASQGGTACCNYIGNDRRAKGAISHTEKECNN